MPNMPKYLINDKDDPRDTAARLGDKTFDPLQMIDLRAAVKARKEECEIQGRRYMINYYPDKFFFKPIDARIPCGYWRYDHLFDRSEL